MAGGKPMRLASLVVAAVLVIVSSGCGFADAWPSRPIRWIVPYPPGGGTDVAARLIGEKLAQRLHQPVVVDNRPGANTIIGTSAMAQAEADGHTIGLITDAFSANLALNRSTPYDPRNDLVPIVRLLEVPFVLVVNPDLVPARTLSALVAHAKANPGWLTLASLGPGSPHETALAWFTKMAGVDALIVPYRGGNPAMQDLLAGQVKGMMYGSSSALEMIRAGKVVAVAVTGRARLDSLPDVPTIREQGFPDYDFASWFGVVAPAKTPEPILRRLNEEINLALKQPDVRDKIMSTGALVTGGTALQFHDFMAADVVRYQNIFALTGGSAN
jgi:tripartite-type tricarboxylate transporter receptor subunit TctC